MFVVMLGVATVAFLLLRLSGDPVALLVPEGTPPAEIERLRESMGFNRPIPVQFVDFLVGLAQGDFGRSIIYRRPALEVVGGRLGATVELALVGMALGVAFGLAIGMVSALKRNTAVDRVGMTMAMIGQAAPSFALGILGILIFSLYLGWLPTGGRGSLTQLVMPATTLAVLVMPPIARITRSEVIQALHQDYVRTARAKGLSRAAVLWRHALRNASLPIITIAGLQLGALLGGAVIIEVVFSWPGLGQLAVRSISDRDYPVVQTVVILAAVSFVVVNTAVDILYGALDPRTRDR